MQVAEAYGCNLVEGVLSHQLKQFIIDANKCVLNKPSPEQKVRTCVPTPPPSKRPHCPHSSAVGAVENQGTPSCILLHICSLFSCLVYRLRLHKLLIAGMRTSTYAVYMRMCSRWVRVLWSLNELSYLQAGRQPLQCAFCM